MIITDTLNFLLFTNPISATFYYGIGQAGNALVHLILPGNYQPAPVSMPIIHQPLWKLAGNNINFIRLAGISGATAVLLGEYGAYKTFPEDLRIKEDFNNANRFHFIHSVLLISMPLVRRPMLSGSLIISGMIFYCIPQYHRALTPNKIHKKFKLQKMGLICLTCAWISIIL